MHSAAFFDRGSSTSRTANGHAFREYHDPPPLTIQDLTDSTCPHWSTRLKTRSTFLLTRIEGTQRPRIGDAAQEVYQRQYEGEWVHDYLVCWPDRIAEVSFSRDREVTPEQISTAAAVLKAA